jgi:hypothetical protein
MQQRDLNGITLITRSRFPQAAMSFTSSSPPCEISDRQGNHLSAYLTTETGRKQDFEGFKSHIIAAVREYAQNTKQVKDTIAAHVDAFIKDDSVVSDFHVRGGFVFITYTRFLPTDILV